MWLTPDVAGNWRKCGTEARPSNVPGAPKAMWHGACLQRHHHRRAIRLRQMPPPLPLQAVSGLQPAWIAERWSAAHNGQEDERLLLWSCLSLQGIIGQKRSTDLAA